MAHDEQWLTPRLQTAQRCVTRHLPQRNLRCGWGWTGHLRCGVDGCRLRRSAGGGCLDWADVVRDGIVWDFFGAVPLFVAISTLLSSNSVAVLASGDLISSRYGPAYFHQRAGVAGLEVSHVLDEPTAVADLLHWTTQA